MRKYSLCIITISLISLLLVGFLAWKNTRNDEVVSASEETNPLKIIDCEFAPKFTYWSYWSKDYDYSKYAYEETKDKRQGNFYISCKSEGIARMINAYVFKDYKLLFKKEDIRRGRFFEGNENNFYVIQEIMNPEASAYPLGYVLTRYEFDSAKNTLAEKETKEYKTKEEIEKLYQFEKENNLNFEEDDFYKILN